MHVHILTKVLDQKKGDWDMQKGPDRDTCLHITMPRDWNRCGVRWTCTHLLMHLNILTKMWDQLGKRGGADVESQVEMQRYTDAGIHSNHDVRPKEW